MKNADRQQLWLIPSTGTPATQLMAEVALLNRERRTRQYAVPEPLRESIAPGALLRVPLRDPRRFATAVCVRTSEVPWDQTAPAITDLLAARSSLTPELIQLALWVADYYFCPPGVALATACPTTSVDAPPRMLRYLRKTDAVAQRPLTSAQRTIIDALGDGPRRRSELTRSLGVSAARLRTLLRAALLEEFSVPEPAGELPAACTGGAFDPDAPEDNFELSDAQHAALQTITASQAEDHAFVVHLLFGVPGSGKTEVYVRAIRAAIGLRRQAILIVPEIALATQIVARLARRFERVCVLHSRLTPAVRGRALTAIAGGAVDVVIGTRTAVFAPLPDLGLIIVDEEQDQSLKNLAAPRYHARDVAIKRAQMRGAAVVLGSATPALETWHNAQTASHFRLLRLPQRVGDARLPEVQIVAAGDGRADGAQGMLSPPLEDAIRETLASGEQIVLLLNRRGFAAQLRCPSCGLLARCPRCTAALVYHRADHVARCHACHLSMPPPATCPDATCGTKLVPTRLAIQYLHDLLAQRFPQARLLRLDSDTMRRRDDYAHALQAFEQRQADVLLGTQMVAKGLDFPGVALVGVIEADASLWIPDFRAAERTFQLVTQVIGRAGRRPAASRAIIQTRSPKLPALQHARTLDYEGFAGDELAHRERLFYPPFSRVLRLILADPRPGQARDEAARLSRGLRRCGERLDARVRVSDAARCVAPRLRELLRYHILAFAPRDGGVQRLLLSAAAEKLMHPRVQRFTIDVDPLDFL